MENLDLFIKNIKRLNTLVKREKDSIDLVLLDSLVNSLFDSIITNVNPGIKSNLLVALRNMLYSLDNIRVVDHNNKIYVIENGNEKYVYYDLYKNIDRYLVIDKCSIGIKAFESYYNYEIGTNVIDVTTSKMNSLVGTIMSFNNNGVEMHRSVTEVAKPDNELQFERNETYDRDLNDDTLVRVRRQVTDYTNDKVFSDEFNLFVYYPDLNIDLENYYREDIMNKVLK